MADGDPSEKIYIFSNHRERGGGRMKRYS